MEPDESQKNEAIERILSPRRGRTANAYGERERSDSTEEIAYALAAAFGARPELVYDVHRRSCGLLLRDVQELSSKLLRLPVELDPPPVPFGQPSYDALQRVLQRITPETPLNAPIYQDLEREILKVQGPSSVVGRRYEGDRESALALALTLEKVFEGLVERVSLLANCMAGFEALDLSQLLRSRVLRQGKKEVSRIQREGQKDGGLQTLSILASLKASQVAAPVRYYPKKPSTLSNHPRSQAYPFANSSLRTSSGPFFLTDNIPLLLGTGSGTERVSLPPSPQAALLGRGGESFVWVSSADTGVGAVSFGGNHPLRIYVRRPNGRSTDATVDLLEGNYTADEMVAYLNDRWSLLGASDALEAVNLGTIQIQGKAGAVFAVAPCSAVSVVLPLTPTGGFDLHADALLETTRTAEGPFSLSDSNNRLVLGFVPPTTMSVLLLTVELPTGGSVSASDVRTAINNQLTAYQLDVAYSASLDGSRVYLEHLTSEPGYQISIHGSAALSALGWVEQEVDSQYDNRALIFYLSNTDPEFEVVESFDLSAYTGLLSGEDLVDALEQELGASYQAVLSGQPGARSITLFYKGPGKETAGLRAWDGVGGGLGRYLDFFPGITVSARRTTWLDVLPTLRSRWTRPTLEAELSSPVSVTASFSPLNLGIAQVFRVRGTASVVGEGEGPGTVRLHTSSALLVGEKVKLLSPPYLGSVGTVASVTETEAIVLGISFTSVEAVDLVAGPSLENSAGHVMEVDSATQSPMTVVRALDPLTLEVRGFSPFLDTELSARVGPARLRIEHGELLSISTDPGYEPWLSALFPAPVVPPYPVWVTSSDEVPVQVGDTLRGYLPSAPTTIAYQGDVVEVESRSSFRVDPPLPDTAIQAIFSVSPSSSQMRATLESRGHVLQEASEASLRSYLAVTGTLLKKGEALRRSIYQATSVASPSVFLLASLSAAVREVTDTLLPLSQILENRAALSPPPDLVRLEEFLEDSGAEGCVQALQQCRWGGLLEAASTDLFQNAFERLREALQTLLARGVEDEDDQEDATTYPDDEGYEEDGLSWHNIECQHGPKS